MLDWLPENVSTYGEDIDGLFAIIYYFTTGILLLVLLALVTFLVLYRQRPGHKASYIKGNARLEWIWTGVTLALLVVMVILSRPLWATIKERPRPDSSPITAQVRGNQFNWVILYAGPDNQIGTADDLQVENELHVPVHTDIWLSLVSEDVIHSFFVPQLRLKQDAVPGREIPVWFQATSAGDYEIACAELCGFGHTTMRGWLHVLPPDAYEAWQRQHWPHNTNEDAP